jgi:hypothetical protein
VTYELAKQLLITGYPMTVSAPEMKGCMQLHTGLWYAIPTLSELIQACVDDRDFQLHWWHQLKKWDAYKSGILREGSTPEEAVARLWLALCERQFVK